MKNSWKSELIVAEIFSKSSFLEEKIADKAHTFLVFSRNQRFKKRNCLHFSDLFTLPIYILRILYVHFKNDVVIFSVGYYWASEFYFLI